MGNKGQFTQGVAVLFEQAISLAELERLLNPFNILKRVPEGSHWALAGPTLMLDYLPAVNGRVSVDIVAQPWPDAMEGDDKGLFVAYDMGCFGPFAYPENLTRAIEHSLALPEAASLVARHSSFVRVRSGYRFGADPHAPILPPGYDAVAELAFVTSIALALLQHPAALCYFNPNGEVLCQAQTIVEVQAHYARLNLPPIDLWTQLRTFSMPEGWMLMDTVGMQQLDLDDLEVVFPADRFDPQDMARFLRKASLFLSSRGPMIRPGHSLDGPGDTPFVARAPQEGPVAPPRNTMRFIPQGSQPPPQESF